MDHYVPKRRIPVSLWSGHLMGLQGWVFLDLDAEGRRHQTVLEKLNETTRFLPVAIGEEGRIQLINKAQLSRLSTGRLVIQSDVFCRGFQPWREEEAEVEFEDGTLLNGRIWMPLERESQRLSDFMNQPRGDFVALVTPVGIHLVNTRSVVAVRLQESAGAPIASFEAADDGMASDQRAAA